MQLLGFCIENILMSALLKKLSQPIFIFLLMLDPITGISYGLKISFFGNQVPSG